ncbi:hypothetical protein [Streptomyces sp. GMR22]|uniref:hypothetical protein n=1 Tax=Streptomyces sp. GMR22 TaxID=2759524 RepID=UPI0015FC6A84|nr:hypothetical protein [Streptomyces sp. GMR22]MBA6434712.1 hypothetical protein [Streptomyces sp. GMR22]
MKPSGPPDPVCETTYAGIRPRSTGTQRDALHVDATADGYLQASVFGLILPLLAMNYGIATGSRAMHDDERERRQHPGRPARGAGRLCHGPIRPGIKIP